MISAWLNTKLERDKQLLGLSVTAIGLLVTLLRTLGVSSLLQIIFFGLALLAFLITVISVIFILGENAEHIEAILKSDDTENEKLKFLDRFAGVSFVIGMVLIVIMGMHSAVVNLSTKETVMSPEKNSDTHHQSKIQQDSWNGVSKLRPEPPKSSSNNPQTTPDPESSSANSSGNGSSNGGKSGSSS